jgi:hypothetical protein
MALRSPARIALLGPTWPFSAGRSRQTLSDTSQRIARPPCAQVVLKAHLPLLTRILTY